MVSTSGAQLLPQDAIRHLTKHLLPHTTVLTPNIPEAALILAENSAGPGATPVRSVADLEAVGRAILAMGPEWVLVKGGHAPFGRDFCVAETEEERCVVVDVLVGRGGEEVVRVESPYQKSSSTHGTGCSLACEFLPLFVVLWLTRESGHRIQPGQGHGRSQGRQGCVPIH